MGELPLLHLMSMWRICDDEKHTWKLKIGKEKSSNIVCVTVCMCYHLNLQITIFVTSLWGGWRAIYTQCVRATSVRLHDEGRTKNRAFSLVYSLLTVLLAYSDHPFHFRRHIICIATSSVWLLPHWYMKWRAAPWFYLFLPFGVPTVGWVLA